jgi:hypothetical protein
MTPLEIAARDALILRLADELNDDWSFKYTFAQITEMIAERWPLTERGRVYYVDFAAKRYVKLRYTTRERVRDQRRIREGG